jgi:hypothetical protein
MVDEGVGGCLIGFLNFAVTANDGTTYPKETEVKYYGDIESLAYSVIYDGGMEITLPNGEVRKVEPDCVDFGIA